MADHIRNMPNVIFEGKYMPSAGVQIEWTNIRFREVIYDLYELNPSWRFVVDSKNEWNGRFIITRVSVQQRGTRLGVIGGDYFRNVYGIRIDNNKIQGKGMWTGNVKRALTIVKKYFVLPSINDRFESLDEAFSNTIRNVQRSLEIDSRETIHNIKELALDYSMQVIRPQFEAHLQQQGKLYMLDKFAEKIDTGITIERILSLIHISEPTRPY